MDIKRILKHVRYRMTLRVTLRQSPGEHVHGFVVAVCSEFLLLQVLADFQLYGFAAIPWPNIVSFRSGRFERFAERVLKGEGVTAKVRPPARIRIGSMASLFESLRVRKQNVTIETAKLSAKAATGENCFYLGRVVSVEARELRIRAVTALGKWDRSLTRVRFDEMIKIQIDDPYTIAFSKYAPYPGD